VDCDVKEFWVITNEKVWGHSENKAYSQILVHPMFLSKRNPQLAIVLERPTIVLAELALLLYSC